MTDINNSVGLDASQANAQLDLLTKNLNEANAAMIAFATTSSRNITNPFDAIGASAARAGRAGTDATRAIGAAADDASNRTRSLGLSFQDVARIIQSQIIFAALADIKQGFIESADAAAEFQLQVSRIAAIAPEMENVRGQVEALAVATGRSLEEVGEATFEGLQNDLGDTAETMEILDGTAGDLALVTGGTLPQAVNAVSSIIKGFGLNLDEARGIAGQLFGTINAGRITLKDLESSLGTLAPLGREAGVGLQDTLDALATITLTGTEASVATTQLRNVFNKAIKPTESLSKVYQDLGVKGFQGLVDREGGLVGALQAITGAVDNDEQKIAKLFNTIRGNLGVLNTLTRDGQLFAETADRSAVAAEGLGDAISNIEATEAREAARQAAQLEVIFTQVGDTALKFKNDVVGAFLTVIDDADKARAAIAALGVGFVGASASVALFGTAALGVLGPLAVAAGAGSAIGIGLAKGFDVAREALRQADLDVENFNDGSLTETLKILDKINADRVKELNKEFENTESILNTVTTAAQRAASGIEKAFDLDFANIGEAESRLIGTFGEARERVLNNIGDAIDDIDNQIKAGTSAVESLLQADLDFRFSESLKDLDPAQKQTALMSKSAREAAVAFEKLAKAGVSQEARDAADAQAEQAISTGKAALAQARINKDTGAIKALINQVSGLYKAQAKSRSDANKQLAAENKTVLLDELQALTNVSNADKERIAQAVADRKKLAQAVKDGADEQALSDLAGVAAGSLEAAFDGLGEFASNALVQKFNQGDIAKAANAQLKEGLANIAIDSVKLIGKLREDLAAAPTLQVAAEIIAELDEASVTAAVSRAIQLGILEGGNAGQQLDTVANNVKEIADAQNAAQVTIQRGSVEVEKSVNSASAKFKQFKTDFFGGAPGGADQLALDAAKPGLDAIEKIGTATEAQLIKSQSAIATRITELGVAGSEASEGLSQSQIKQVSEGLDAALDAVQSRLSVIRAQGIFSPQVQEDANKLLEGLNEIAGEDVLIPVDSSQVKQANTQLDSTKQKASNAAVATASIGTAASGAKTQVGNLNSTTGDLEGSADDAAAAFARLEAAAKAAAQAARDAASVGTQFASTGGQFFASGGRTRGQDIIPATLSPGEMVIGAQQTRNFLPELQAINAGNAPSGASGSDGGTSITIGDINVSSTAQLPNATAREVGFAIKRELRRGNLN